MATLISTIEIRTLGHRLANLQWGLLISASSLYFPSKIRQLLDFVLTVVLTITLSINIPLQTSIMLMLGNEFPMLMLENEFPSVTNACIPRMQAFVTLGNSFPGLRWQLRFYCLNIG